MNKKIIGLLLNLTVAAAPIAVLCLVLEFGFFKNLLPSLPMRYHQRLMEPYQMLTQRSKKETMPHNYTLILGDSYAAGWGDWLRGVDIGKNEPYGAHDLIYQKTDIDTVQGGFAGGSATETLVRKPVNRYRFLRKTLLYKPEDPKHILYFFYEANDLIDDLQRLSSPYKGKIDESRLYDEKVFHEFLDTEVMKSDALYYDVKRFKWHYNYVSAYLIKEIARNLFQHYSPSGPAVHIPAKPGSNCYPSGSGPVCIPHADILSSPIYLTEDEMKKSLYILGESLDYLREFFPKPDITLVYIPSVITSYPVTSEEVSAKIQNAKNTFVEKTAVVFKKSDGVFERVNGLAAARGIRVIDTRPALRRAASENGFLHGPQDWHHLNRRGYETLADAVVDGMGWPRKE